MKIFLKILLLMLVGASVYSQVPTPKGLPHPYNNGYERTGWVQVDSGFIAAPRDTVFRPKYLGTEIVWLRAGVDTSMWMWTGRRWVKELKAGDIVQGVSAFNTRTGNVFLLSSDIVTALGGNPLLNITNYITAGSNVTIGGLGTLASPYIINSTASGTGSVTQFNFTNGNGITGSVTNSTTTPTLSLGTSLNGIINANGSGFGTVTIGSGLNYSGGVLTATGGTSLSGLISGNGSIFTTASIGAGLSFTSNTLTNTITNTNQLTNGSGFITNITGLVTAGTNITVTGSGTSGSPFVINSTGGGGGGTVTTFSAGNMPPLFTTNVTNPTTIPGLSFTLSNATANSVFGNNTGSSAVPVYYVPTSTTLNGWFGGTIQSAISLTTTGTGAATLTGATLNIPTNVQTLTYTQNATNNTLALTGVSTQNFLTATTNLAGLLDTARARFVDSLKNGLKTFNLFVANRGASGFGTIFGAGGDSILGKKLIAGANITITQNADSSMTIASSGGGGGGIGIDSTITITSGSSSTVTNGFNVVRFNPTTLIASYTLTLPTTWHSSNDLLIAFTANGTITNGNPMVTTLVIVNGSGQTLSQAVVPTTGNAGEVIRYHLISNVDQRVN